MSNFVKGKYYYNINGVKPFVVLDVFLSRAKVKYVGSEKVFWVPVDKIESRDENGDKKMTKYKLKNHSAEYHLVGTDQQGQAVLETLRGKFFTAGYSDIEKVVPYTVKIRLASNGEAHHYFSKEGDVAVGDRLFVNDDLATVVKINSRSSLATMPLTGEKISTTPIDPHYNE